MNVAEDAWTITRGAAEDVTVSECHGFQVSWRARGSFRCFHRHRPRPRKPQAMEVKYYFIYCTGIYATFTHALFVQNKSCVMKSARRHQSTSITLFAVPEDCKLYVNILCIISPCNMAADSTAPKIQYPGRDMLHRHRSVPVDTVNAPFPACFTTGGQSTSSCDFASSAC